MALIALAVVAGAVAAVTFGLPRASEAIRERLVAQLNRDFDGEADIQALHLSLRPSPRVALRTLVIRHKGRRDLPPLIRVGSLTADLSLGGWMAHRLDRVSIEGLHVFIPPRSRDGAQSTDSEPSEAPERPGEATSVPRAWFIDRLIASDTRLSLAVEEPGVPPREFRIHRLAMSSVGAERVMAFDAALSNPKPVGEIQTTGTFGPWQKDQPSLTPLEATYAFSHADLGTIKGLGGILDSEGAFRGVLERIVATGSTTTPDFRLSLGGHPVPLTTRFKAIIDGTNGNTELEHIDATLGRSRLVVSGAVIGKPDVDGRTITIDATIPDGHLEDVLRLTSKGQTPPIRGRIEATARLLLPPGERDVIDKLQLAGTFRIMEAHFASAAVRSKLEDLSKRAQGKPKERGGPSPVSYVDGSFTLQNTVMTFPHLTFGVPGALIALSGRYSLRQETLDFLGTVRMRASASRTMTGWKRVIFRPFDPLFRRDGAGTVLPIHIEGTRDDPAFRIDVKSALLRRDPS